ncbi:MAG: hypothetical protein E6I52_14510 [Chloroflexi bacterium]|nr:MAG: hypothetical protein E6I52_14510 [Chloroflexota bacterium]
MGLDSQWPWLALGALGVYHGLNPAMGWLFAVALGFLKRSRRAVLEALIPIAIGHELAVGAVVLLVAMTQAFALPDVRPVGAIALVAFGLFKLRKPLSHPRWVGMQVSRRDLVVWSFLMSSAHGAGLMLFPVLLGLPAVTHVEDPLPTGLQDLAAVGLHTAAMLLTMAVIAVIVYERLGVMVLRKAWVNLDLLWSVAVIGAGLVTLFT